MTDDTEDIEVAEVIEEELEITPLVIDPTVDRFPPFITPVPSVILNPTIRVTADTLVADVIVDALEISPLVMEPLVDKLPLDITA